MNNCKSLPNDANVSWLVVVGSAYATSDSLGETLRYIDCKKKKRIKIITMVCHEKTKLTAVFNFTKKTAQFKHAITLNKKYSTCFFIGI